MLVYIGGVPGVGKTTIIKEAEKIARKQGTSLEKIKCSKILCELAGVNTVEELRALPESTRQNLRPEMNRQIYKFDRANSELLCLVDGHFVLFDINGKEHGIRQIQQGDKEQLLAIVVVVANPQTILNRRLKDTDRHDRQQSIGFLIKEQEMETTVAVSQAAKLGIPLCFISNENKETKIAAELLFSFCNHQAACKKILGNTAKF